MSKCNGNGECFNQSDDTDDEYTQYDCAFGCKLKPCHNFEYCHKLLPQWVLYCHNDMCPNCSIMMDKLFFTHNIKECPICTEDREMIRLKCKHELCITCLEKIRDQDEISTSCPICRDKVWWR